MRREHWYRITRERAGRQISATMEGRSIVYPYGARVFTPTGPVDVHSHVQLNRAAPGFGSLEIRRRDWRCAWIARVPRPPDGLPSLDWAYDNAPA